MLARATVGFAEGTEASFNAQAKVARLTINAINDVHGRPEFRLKIFCGFSKIRNLRVESSIRTTLFASAADVTAMIANAKAERKPAGPRRREKNG